MTTSLYTEEHAYKLIATACEFLPIGFNDILNKCRKKIYTVPRFLVWKYMHDNLEYSKSLIGRVFKKDHTTIMSGIKAANNLIDTDADVCSMFEELETYMYCKGYKDVVKEKEEQTTYPLSIKQIHGIKNVFASYAVKKDFYTKYNFQHTELASMYIKRRYTRKLRGRVEILLKDIQPNCTATNF